MTPTEQERIFVSYTSDRCLIFSTYKELRKQRHTHKIYPFKKMGLKLTREFSTEENRDTKR